MEGLKIGSNETTGGGTKCTYEVKMLTCGKGFTSTFQLKFLQTQKTRVQTRTRPRRLEGVRLLIRRGLLQQLL